MVHNARTGDLRYFRMAEEIRAHVVVSSASLPRRRPTARYIR
jgi:hypothetical protein